MADQLLRTSGESAAVVPLVVSESDSDGVAPMRSRRGLVASGLLICGMCLAVFHLQSSGSAMTSRSYDDAVEFAAVEASGDDDDEEDNDATGDDKDATGDDKADKGAEKAPELKCSWNGQNCNATKCCNNPGMVCYEQSEFYATCKVSCTPGPDPLHWDGVHWSCKELGERSEGETKCSELGEDCRETKCCTTTNTQCFEKNSDWATCKSECESDAPDLADSNGDPWSCKKLGPWTQGAAPWVAEECSADGDDCTEKKCCQSPGAQCYKQSDFWAQCKYECNPGVDPERSWEPEWNCEEVGIRTPGSGGMIPGKIGDWVVDTCADLGADCSKSKCCLGMNAQCYQKNEDWAMCMEDCTKGPHADDNNDTWSCLPLGPRSVTGLSIRGSPSLFCWSLFQTTTYENDIMKVQLSQGAGIFQCDEYALLSTDDETVMGNDKGGKEIKTLKVKKAEITTSVDGTAGNAQLFINSWQVVIDSGRWRHHAWIIKVDPDAVIIPDRVRDHLRDHVLENVYVVNCNKFPSSPNFPMMYGSVEIYSYKAIDTYARNMGLCFTDMGMMLPQWGEDYFMTHCLDHIGVGRISDFASVGDSVCTGGGCDDAYFSAFHPFKDAGSWQGCWDAAHGNGPAPAPQWGR